MTHYERIEIAIKYLIAHYQEQPSLEVLARVSGVSEFYFQRMFTEWAGVSPKQFLGYLTVEALKNEILRSQNMIEATECVGLSSQSRGYDLMVKIEAVTPGEYKSFGKGLRMEYGFAESPFGLCFVAATSRGVCNFQFVDGDAEELLLAYREEWAAASHVQNDAMAENIIRHVFTDRGSSLTGRLSLFTDRTSSFTDRTSLFTDRTSSFTDQNQPLNLHLKGTPFQIKVWEALLSIPSGSVVTYSELAQLVHHDKAVRAVASAVARNPVGLIIPCHRVIRKEGVIGQYHWKSERKASIIGWEKAKREVELTK